MYKNLKDKFVFITEEKHTDKRKKKFGDLEFVPALLHQSLWHFNNYFL